MTGTTEMVPIETPDITPLWTSVANDPGGNVPALIGLLLLSWFGIDRLSSAGLFLIDSFRPGWLRSSRAAGEGDAAQRRLLLYYVIAIGISFLVTVLARVRIMEMIGIDLARAGSETFGGVAGWLGTAAAWVGVKLDNLVSAILLATGGEGLGRVLEIGGAQGAAGSTVTAPIEVKGDVLLVPDPAAEGPRAEG